MNQMLTHFFEITGIKHHMTIPYSKEENGIVERANKEVNRHIRNILFDKNVIPNWSKMLCMTEKLLNSSVKLPLGVSPNTLLFGNAFQEDTSLLSVIDRDTSNNPSRSVRDYVDTLIDRQAKLIEAAVQSQQSTNQEHMRRRYAQYSKSPKLRLRVPADDTNHIKQSAPVSISHILATQAPPKPPILAAVKWILHTDPASGVSEYIKVIQSQPEVIDTIAEIDINPYVPTTYQVNDYVLRRYPPTKLGGGNPHKYGSWWRGPYQVMSIVQKPVSDAQTKPRYTIRNLVTGKEYMVDVTHLRPFYFDPAYVTPLNIAVKDTDKFVVDRIVAHDFTNVHEKKWLVRWAGTDTPEETWENYDTLKNVEAFHQYCAALQIDPFPPKTTSLFPASKAHLERLAGHQLPVPVIPQTATHAETTHPKKRGRPRKVI